MNRNTAGEVQYLTFPAFEQISFLYHAFSTRKGGVSSGIFSTMNLSFGRGDAPENVTKNFEILCDALHIKTDTLVFSAQTHTANILSVTKADCGKGLTRPKTWNDVDGLVTADPDVTLVTHYADCVPLFFADPVKKIVGAAHAGWRGTVAGIGGNMIRLMTGKYDCDPRNILVGIGPSIGQCCFETDQKTADEFFRLPDALIQDCIKKRPDPADPVLSKFDIHLQGVNRNILIHAGVLPEHIEITDICTKCNHEWLFSHRATNGERGGMVAMIGMRSRENQ